MSPYFKYVNQRYPVTGRKETWLKPQIVPLRGIANTAWINNHMPSQVWDEITYPFPSSGIDKEFHSILYNGCNYLSMLGLKLIHDSKRVPGSHGNGNDTPLAYLSYIHVSLKRWNKYGCDDIKCIFVNIKLLQIYMIYMICKLRLPFVMNFKILYLHWDAVIGISKYYTRCNLMFCET